MDKIYEQDSQVGFMACGSFLPVNLVKNLVHPV